jgi:hypothetical protein
MRICTTAELHNLLHEQNWRLSSAEGQHLNELHAESGRVCDTLSSQFGEGFQDVACTQDASFFADIRIPISLLVNSSCKWVSIRLSNTKPLASVCREDCILPECLNGINETLESMGYIVIAEKVFLDPNIKSDTQVSAAHGCIAMEPIRNDPWEELFGHW